MTVILFVFRYLLCGTSLPVFHPAIQAILPLWKKRWFCRSENGTTHSRDYIMFSLLLQTYPCITFHLIHLLVIEIMSLNCFYIKLFILKINIHYCHVNGQ